MNSDLRREVTRWLRYAEEDLREADLERLTEYAVESRYPADMPDITAEEAARAVEDASRLVAAVHDDLHERTYER